MALVHRALIGQCDPTNLVTISKNAVETDPENRTEKKPR